MTSVLDTAIHVGKESTYGTPVTPTRSFEGYADSFKRAQDRLESTGFRAGMQAVRSDRVVQVNMGGAGSLEVDVLDKGMGLLLEGLLGSTTGPTQVGATTAYTQVHDSSSTGPSESYTVQVIRPLVDGSTQQFTHHGAKPTGWSISQDSGGLLKLNIDFDFEDVDTDTAAASAAYVASTTPFSWQDAVVTIDSVAFDYATDFEFTADLSQHVDRRYLKSTAPLKSVPVRSGIPEYTGTVTADFSRTDEYADWVSGAVFPISVKWSGATDAIESGYTFEFEVSLPACQWTGESPESSNTALTAQPLPFKALDNGTDPVVTVNIQSTDTAL